MSTILRSPSRFLVEYAHLLPRGEVLDVAAGSGRNTLSLAEHGFTVHAIDRNPKALMEVQLTARDRHLMHVTTAVVDLEGEPFPHHIFPQATYDVVIVFFYLFRPLFPTLVRTLKPGGMLMYETFLIDNYLKYQRPRHPEFCLAHGELRTLVQGLQVLQYDEEAREGKDRQGETYTARLLARKEGG
jgi:2-polyprenyl-3-methyl-5-hydroxy-6-metoxy-1,4-benzoquinol methylase